jgi:hypothetical protein
MSLLEQALHEARRHQLRDSGDATVIPGFRFKSLRAWLEEYQAPRWLIREFLMADAFDVFGGAEKSLKSWLMHHCAIAIGAGVPLFNAPHFSVSEPGTVLLLTGEGGVDLVLDRVRHLCHGMYQIAVDDVLDRIIVTADIAPMSSPTFEASVTAAIEQYEPVLVQLDPLYVYFGEDREAGNVYSTGPALMRLRALTQGRALQVAHHFTKVGADKLTLASLTQAGMREAVDHWLLVGVDGYDLAKQQFDLRLERGARRGLAWSRRAHVTLGPFNTETLQHSGEPSVTFEPGSGAGGGSDSPRLHACATAAVEAAKNEQRPLSTRELVALIDVRARAELKRAGIDRAVGLGALQVQDGPRGARMHSWLHDLEAPT